MTSAVSPLLTDLYQLTMVEAYLDHGETEAATFEFFVRKLPRERNFLMAAGLEQLLSYLETLRFSDDELDWLAKTRQFKPRLIDYLKDFRFIGDVDAMREGTIFFANEPIVRVTAPLPQAQLIETRLMNIVHFQSLIASKAARVVLSAPGKLLVDFGLRRAHGSEAGLLAARASYMAGFAGTATVLAWREFGIPAFGTMAHSYIQVHDSESVAFERFAHSRPKQLTLLIDTYDTEEAAHKVVAIARRLSADGINIRSVRLDSGDLSALSKAVRRILDDGGLSDVSIFASGGIDERMIAALVSAKAPIDGFGVGTSLTTSSDAPALDCAYKLQDYAGLPRRKKSSGKATWPGKKQVWRRLDPDGLMASDTLSLLDDAQQGAPLLEPVMRSGLRVGPSRTLDDARAHAARELDRLPVRLRQLEPSEPYPVHIAPSLLKLTEAVEARLASHQESSNDRDDHTS
jgi:nicotinate phosphoribosyltransferase